MHVLWISPGSQPCPQFSVLKAQRTVLHRNREQWPCETVAEYYCPGGRKNQNPTEITSPAALPCWKLLFLLQNKLFWIQSWQLCRLQKDSPWSHMSRRGFLIWIAWHFSSGQSKDTRDIFLSQKTPWRAYLVWAAHPRILNVLSLR